MEIEKVVLLATRKRRFVAFIIDLIIIGIVGKVSALLLEDFYVSLGGLGKLIGALVVLLYFGICDSKIMLGQSVGKKLAKICVVNEKSASISLLRSLARSSWLAVWILLNGVSFSSSKAIPLVILCGVILFSIILLEIYFFIANKKTRQSLHDLIAGSYVVTTRSSGEISFTNSKTVLRCSAIIPVFMLIAISGFNIVLKNTYMKDMLGIVDVVQRDLPLHATSVNRTSQETKSGGIVTRTNFICVSTFKNSRDDDDASLAAKIAESVISSGFEFKDNESLVVVIQTGYNIGIASKTDSKVFSGSLDQWKAGTVEVRK